MVPMPEDIEPAGSIEEAMDLFRKSAKSHNHILTDYLRLKEQYEWLQRQMFGTRSEKLHKATQDPQGEPPGQDSGSSALSVPTSVRHLKDPKKPQPSRAMGGERFPITWSASISMSRSPLSSKNSWMMPTAKGFPSSRSVKK